MLDRLSREPATTTHRAAARAGSRDGGPTCRRRATSCARCPRAPSRARCHEPDRCPSTRPPGARHARLRRRHRPRGARHPAGAACGRLRLRDLRRDGGSAPRGPDGGLPRPGRRGHPDDILIHHFSIGSRASRTAYALPGQMVLVYHNITPPEYFIGVHKDLVKLCFRGRRELTAYIDRCDLALGDSEYNRQELDALGFRADRRAPGGARLLTPRRVAGRGAVAPVRRRLDERAVRRTGDPQQEVRRRDPRVPRLPHAAQPAVAPAARRLVRRVRAATSRMLQGLVATLGPPTSTSSGTSATRS